MPFPGAGKGRKVNEMDDALLQLKQQAAAATEELLAVSGIGEGSILVVGCSSSEISGDRIASNSKPLVADAVYAGIAEVLSKRHIFLAAQCCEHLNRALIVEKEIYDKEIRFYADRVNVVPQPKAGGSFATAAYREMKNPVAVEAVRADAGIDIGGTLIGMHLKKVAVPVRLRNNRIGEAFLLAARTRLKFTGGSRAVYDENLL